MARSRPVPSPPLGLRIRMVIALLVQAVLVGALLAPLVLLVLEGAWQAAVFLLLVASLGWTLPQHVKRRRSRRRARPAQPRDDERVGGAVQRLAMVGGLEPPMVEVETSAVPLSWTVARPWGRPTLHVTTGLLDRVGDEELEAVVAHELGHLANRDAVLMTLVAAPSTALLGSIRAMWREARDGDPEAACAFLLMLPVFGPLGILLTLSGRIVSRHRELAADRTAVALTGSPAGLAAALMTVDGALRGIPAKDLRVVASRDPFHFVPATEARGMRRLWATHPRTAARVRLLEHMEDRLQGR